MKASVLYLLALLATEISAAQFFKNGPFGSLEKRVHCGFGDTCQEACGGGAIQCGASGDHCYDPTLGEVGKASNPLHGIY